MRSARMLVATAAATAALAIAAPAYADSTGEWDHEDSSHSKEHDEDSSYGKKHDKDSSHDAPRGGMHTGGGALALVNNDEWAEAKDPKHDPDTYRDDHDGEHGEDSWGGDHDGGREGEHQGGHDGGREGEHEGGHDGGHDRDSGGGDHDRDSGRGDHHEEPWKSDHDKPHGGVHTGGGALASPEVTTAGLAVLAVAGTGLYALRRKKASEGMA
ncbi:hypothetical protein [Streptomyces sp. GESEQ-35]|uniref:hypothetical protein n=1 Tax=Streptomyces sp. GESEQ-35 TaxID=2812657 RepID=UPI001B340838|nr:hypothetical protein [Streptomyces sp. GESEQ-35]